MGEGRLGGWAEMVWMKQSPRRTHLGSKRPRSEQWVSTRKQGSGKVIPERRVSSKACRNALKCWEISPVGGLLRSPNEGVLFACLAYDCQMFGKIGVRPQSKSHPDGLSLFKVLEGPLRIKSNFKTQPHWITCFELLQATSRPVKANASDEWPPGKNMPGIQLTWFSSTATCHKGKHTYVPCSRIWLKQFQLLLMELHRIKPFPLL